MEVHTITRDGESLVILLDNQMRPVKPVNEFLRFQYGKDRVLNKRILKLRTGCRSAPNKDFTVIKKDVKAEYEALIAKYRAENAQLKKDKENLIAQLVETEELREEVKRLRERLIQINKT